uniref:Uncharacterized protein n=1 Tax=Candidatus Kentrum sp. MB TaxID=2138164 RepID=A0A450X8G7_9GAMM|nr:MAG: hypothetical protein BECKMB1821G_GA0114241_101437 [Candidatus Kentron sp. MB]
MTQKLKVTVCYREEGGRKQPEANWPKITNLIRWGGRAFLVTVKLGNHLLRWRWLIKRQ